MWIDNLIGFFSPKAAYEREVWRQQFDAVKNYDAANFGRLNANWRVSNESAEMTDRYSRDTVRARARDLERNSDILNGVILSFKRNVVGMGYTLQAKTGSERINSAVETLWTEWCRKENCDVTGMQSFNQIIRMMVERKKVDGGILIRKCYTNQGIIPFQLQLIEVDELCTYWQSPHESGNKVVGGIEYNSYNRPVGYWIQKYSVDGMEIPDAKYYGADEIIFYFSKRRPSQIREMSDLTPTLTRVRDTNEFMTAVSVKERIAACLAVFIKKVMPTGGLGRNSQAVDNRSYNGKMLTPGLISELNAGDEIQVVEPKSNGSDATSFLKLQQRLIGAGQGLSYEATSRDMSQTNYSSARQGAIEDELTYAEEKELLKDIMSDIYAEFFRAAVLSGAIKATGFFENADKRRKFLSHDWVESPKRWIDPQKEANANKIALQSGIKTFKQICAEQGVDWRDQIDDIAEVNEYAASKNIDLAAIVFGAGINSAQEAEETPAEEDE